MTNTGIGKRIRLSRERLGLRQEDLASRLSVSAQSVGSWERGEAEPRGRRLEALAQTLAVSMSWLLSGDANAPTQPPAISTSQRVLERVRELLRDRPELFERAIRVPGSPGSPLVYDYLDARRACQIASGTTPTVALRALLWSLAVLQTLDRTVLNARGHELIVITDDPDADRLEALHYEASVMGIEMLLLPSADAVAEHLTQ
jgi:transcriptional regulator with XRE-family HTH domain